MLDFLPLTIIDEISVNQCLINWRCRVIDDSTVITTSETWPLERQIIQVAPERG